MKKCDELYLLRHGQTEWNHARRHQGHLDSRLTATGRRQASAQGEILRRALVGRSGLASHVSPLGRARETAGLALAPLDLAPRVDDRLAEIVLGQWQGLTDAEIFARWPASEALRHADPFGWHFTAPGGESFAEIAARLAAFLEELDGPAVIVSHAIALKVLRGLCLGLDMAGMAALPGGQGVVWRIRGGVHEVLG